MANKKTPKLSPSPVNGKQVTTSGCALSDDKVKIIVAITGLVGVVLGSLITGIFGSDVLMSQIIATNTLTMTLVPLTPTIPDPYLELTAIAMETQKAKERSTAVAQFTQEAGATATQQYSMVLQTVQANLEATRVYEQAQQQVATEQALKAEATAQAIISSQQTVTAIAYEQSKKTVTFALSETAIPEPMIDPIAFRGLDRNCVDIGYWNVGPDYAGYPDPPKSNRCWLLDTWNIYPKDSGLRIVVEDDKLHHNDVRGIYIFTPQSIEIHFSIKVISVSSGDEDVDAMILMGFGSRNTFRTSGRYVKISTNASDNLPYIETGSGITTYYPNTRSNYILGSTQDFTIFLEDSTMRIFFGSDVVYKFTELDPDEHEVFWIGYQIPGKGGNLVADITNFRVIEK